MDFVDKHIFPQSRYLYIKTLVEIMDKVFGKRDGSHNISGNSKGIRKIKKFITMPHKLMKPH